MGYLDDDEERYEAYCDEKLEEGNVQINEDELKRLKMNSKALDEIIEHYYVRNLPEVEQVLLKYKLI
jgi:hypothetical protein